MRVNFGLRTFLIGCIISVILIQTVLCDGDTTATQTEAKQEKSVVVKMPKKSKPERNSKPVIVTAEKVVNPQNWNSWTPVTQNSTNWINVPAVPTPFSPEEQQKRVVQQQIQQEIRNHYQKETKTNTKPTTNTKTTTNTKKVKTTNTKGKSPYENLKKQAMHFGKMLSNFFSAGSSGTGGPAGEFARIASLVTDSSNWATSRGSAYEEGDEDGDSMARAGALGWLTRLIGVEGKTLGEFLREYQVHMLYDLVFIFFKWIFFVYAGLLIP